MCIIKPTRSVDSAAEKQLQEKQLQELKAANVRRGKDLIKMIVARCTEAPETIAYSGGGQLASLIEHCPGFRYGLFQALKASSGAIKQAIRNVSPDKLLKNIAKLLKLDSSTFALIGIYKDAINSGAISKAEAVSIAVNNGLVSAEAAGKLGDNLTAFVASRGFDALGSSSEIENFLMGNELEQNLNSLSINELAQEFVESEGVKKDEQLLQPQQQQQAQQAQQPQQAQQSQQAQQPQQQLKEQQPDENEIVQKRSDEAEQVEAQQKQQQEQALLKERQQNQQLAAQQQEMVQPQNQQASSVASAKVAANEDDKKKMTSPFATGKGKALEKASQREIAAKDETNQPKENKSQNVQVQQSQQAEQKQQVAQKDPQPAEQKQQVAQKNSQPAEPKQQVAQTQPEGSHLKKVNASAVMIERCADISKLAQNLESCYEDAESAFTPAKFINWCTLRMRS